MGVLHFSCCVDDFPPHSPVHFHNLHQHDHHHHQGLGHHHHYHGHVHDHSNHHHHHHRHVHDRRLSVHSSMHEHECPYHRGIGITPGFGLRNPDQEHHVNNNGGENWGIGQMGNVAYHQCPPGQNKNFEAEPNANTRKENHVKWDDLNEMTNQLHDGPSDLSTKNHATAEQAKSCKKRNGCKGASHKKATEDDAVVSYNITIHKHVKGGSGSSKVKKSDIHLEL